MLNGIRNRHRFVLLLIVGAVMFLSTTPVLAPARNVSSSLLNSSTNVGTFFSSSVEEVASQLALELTLGMASPIAREFKIKTVLVEGQFAYVSWVFGEFGGTTALVYTNNQWAVLGGGGGAMDATNLKQYGVPTTVAQKLFLAWSSLQEKRSDPVPPFVLDAS